MGENSPQLQFGVPSTAGAAVLAPDPFVRDFSAASEVGHAGEHNHDGAFDAGAYAWEKACEYGVKVHFIGLLAGVVGSEAEQTRARQAVKDAIMAIFPNGEQPQTPFQAEYQALQDRTQAYNRYVELAQRYPQFVGSGGYAEVANNPNAPAEFREAARAAMGAVDQANEAFLVADRAREEAWNQFWSNLWSSVANIYNDVLQSFRDGTWKVALTKAAIDAGFMVLEEGALLVLKAALVASGIGAAFAAALHLASRVINRAVQGNTAAGKFKMLVTARRTDIQPNVHAPTVRTVEANDIAVSDLTPDESRILFEGNQGNARRNPTPDNGEQRPAGIGHNSAPGKRNALGEREVPCFEVPRGVNRDEFIRQLKEQQATINRMTADDMAYAHAVLDQARHRWREIGGEGSFTNLLRDRGAQEAARDAYAEQLAQQGLMPSQIAEELAGVNATHLLDMIAGGSPSALSIGGAAENQRIGPMWTHMTDEGMSRADILKQEANWMRDIGSHNQPMRVSLNPC